MTQKTKHTPGPWKFVLVPRQEHEDGSVTFPHFRVDGDGFEGIYTDSMLPVGPEEREANALLIAAAPVLLKELETELVYTMQWRHALMGSNVPDFKGRIELIRKIEAREREISAAIAEARGK